MKTVKPTDLNLWVLGRLFGGLDEVPSHWVRGDTFASMLGAFPKLTAAERAAHLQSELWS